MKKTYPVAKNFNARWTSEEDSALDKIIQNCKRGKQVSLETAQIDYPSEWKFLTKNHSPHAVQQRVSKIKRNQKRGGFLNSLQSDRPLIAIESKPIITEPKPKKIGGKLVWTNEELTALETIMEKCKDGKQIKISKAAEICPTEWALLTKNRKIKAIKMRVSYILQKHRMQPPRSKIKTKKFPAELLITGEDVNICPRCYCNIKLVTVACGGKVPKQCPGCGSSIQGIAHAINMPIY